MTSSHSSSLESATPAPLTPEERYVYAAAIVQTDGVFALEDMGPSAQDQAINAAILAGRVSPEQAHGELLAYVREHKTMAGFVASRSWVVR